MVAPIGCAVFLGAFVEFDSFGSPHGRPGATGTGFKRSNPDVPLILYQGDGDCASIGLAETMHAANRGENFTVIMINNQVYGMTGGQAAPTTLPGQKTTTSPAGRSIRIRIPDSIGRTDCKLQSAQICNTSVAAYAEKCTGSQKGNQKSTGNSN